MSHNSRTIVFVFSALALALSALAPAWAHHGEANYDQDKAVTVTGKVADFQFINPHVLIYLDVKGEDNTVTRWVGEATSPNLLLRRGWDKNTIKVGDVVTATGHQAKNGSPTLRLLKVVLADGKEMNDL
ncbi:MAG TPA: DUF6152 family protein [Candidatus Acidoferrales bacterium]|jgi:DNA/RNA endonuclease YhcR with UshA esterase domain|nr:DUF6152 family protein [Candidatus Acidoferrales bacterium]